MIHHRVTLAMIGVSMFVVCVQWPTQAAAGVNIDLGGVHVHVGDRDAAPPPPEAAGVEVLTRGPLNEAFAQPVIFDQGAGFTINRKPPAPIEEMPPDQKPEGNHILWIPGYWSWDTDRSDFIWVSGCWRAAPPGTGWVPGYWAQVAAGYQWIAGFWTPDNTEEIEYLPAPPATLEAGPQGAGSPDSIWIPGCWVRHEGRYAWRPGFWEAARADWVWVPSQYACTPRGCIYVDGYWDYPLSRRGMAFLPIYCPASLYGQAGFEYSPDVVLDLDGLTLNLFISPEHRHYYFGDYYGDAGFHPWYESRDHRDWYDPIFVHAQWKHHDDAKWFQGRQADYEHRRDDKSLRPARTYAAMQTQVAHMSEKDRKQVVFARPMKEVVSDKATPYKFDKLDAKTRESTVAQAKQVHAYKDTRAQWESPAAAPKPGPAPKEVTVPKEVVTPKEPANTLKELPKEPAKEVAPPDKVQGPDHGAVAKEQPAVPDAGSQKVKIPKPPVTVREPVTDKALTPPPRPEQPKPDLTAQPKAPKADAPDRSKDKGASDKP
jgi:hypothetical protein